MIRVVFLGTPKFAVPFLEALATDADFRVLGVVSQPDKPSGRGHQLVSTPTKVTAERFEIPVLQPASLKKDPTIAETLKVFNADIFVVVAYGKIIPKDILDIPKLGCVNVHPSLLPRYRGPSPMQAAIAHGDSEMAISIMKLDEGMDTGPILATSHWALASDETYQSLEKKVHELGPSLLLSTLKEFVAGKITPKVQSTDGVSVTHLLTRDDGKADWNLLAKDLDAKRRAYTPWPGLWTTWNGKLIKLLETEPVRHPEQSEGPRGMVRLDGSSLLVSCADGYLRVTKLQPENAPAMTAEAFVNGHPEINGAKLV